MTGGRAIRSRLADLLRRPVGGFLALFAGIALASIAWALTTPIGGSPDEPQHLIKAAAVVRGELLGDPAGPGAPQTWVEVPRTVSRAQTDRWDCYSFHSDLSASCQTPFKSGLQLERAGTSAGLYNPVYYALVGWPSLVLPTAEGAVYTMRIVSALLVAALLAAAVTLLRRVVAPVPLAVATVAALTPMLLFLSGALNPNAFEVATGALLLAGLLRVTLTSGRPPTRVLVLVAVAGVLLANTRGVSPLWMAMIAVIVLVLSPWRRIVELLKMTSVRISVVVLALGVLAAVAWIVYSGTLGAFVPGPGSGGAVSPKYAFAVMLLTRTFDPSLIGVFGWYDTVTTPLAFGVVGTALVGVVLLAAGLARPRQLAALVIAAAGLIVAPAALTAATIVKQGYIWQGRYGLVALVVLLLVAAVALGSGRRPLTSGPAVVRVAVVLAIAVGVAQLDSFELALRRYAVGTDGSIFGAFSGADWAPPGGAVLWSAMIVIGWILVSAALLAPSAGPLAAERAHSAVGPSSAAGTASAAEAGASSDLRAGKTT